MSIKTIIFDLDGTLVNSIEDLAYSMNKVLENNNLQTHPAENYHQFVGHGIRTLVQKALPETHRDEAFIDKCFEEMNNIYRNNCTVNTKLYDGISELLDALTERGFKLAIFSNKVEAFTQEVVGVLLKKWQFEAVIGLTTEALKKPNPEKVLKLCETLNITAEEVAFVGDTGVDMQTGVRGGMRPVGVLWGDKTEGELVANGAKHIIAAPLELLEVLA